MQNASCTLLFGASMPRDGRSFFPNDDMEAALDDCVWLAADRSGFWAHFDTDWVCLDCELMPWSAKAQQLLVEQYAPTGVAGSTALKKAVSLLSTACGRSYTKYELKDGTSTQDADIPALLNRFTQRQGRLQNTLRLTGLTAGLSAPLMITNWLRSTSSPRKEACIPRKTIYGIWKQLQGTLLRRILSSCPQITSLWT